MKDYTGLRRGKLTFTSFSHYQGSKSHWFAKCDCGNLTTTAIHGSVRSCGCTVRAWNESGNARRSHGMRSAPEYNSWATMKQRCLNPTNHKYPEYGGRGIRICRRWLSFDNFIADMGRRPAPGYTLNRTDNDGPYSPNNCEWADKKAQANNRRKPRTYHWNPNSLANLKPKQKIKCPPI